MAIFINPKTGKEYDLPISTYFTKYPGPVYQDSDRNMIVDPETNDPLIPQTKKVNWAEGEGANIGTYTMMSPERKRQVLMSRADNDFKRNGAEKKRHMLKQTGLKFD